MSSFPKMVEVVPEGEIGIARLEHFEITKNESKLSAMRGGLSYCPEGQYARLTVGGVLMMSDTRMEHGSNYDALRHANGKVLISGLGMGMITVPICQKEEVESVLVLEKSQDVIDLIGPHIAHPKLTVVQADIFEWKPPKGEKWDTIYHDIWPDICEDNLKEIATLKQKFARRRNTTNPKSWHGAWMEDHLRAERRRSQRWERDYAGYWR
jgi:hypothetical protein